ncbi:MAG: hypothetical protein DWP97_02485, partial [Calditrichaeota bacterium]
PSGETEEELAVSEETLTKGKALLSSAVAYAGGMDNINKVNTISQKGTFILSTPQGEIPLQFESLWSAPNKSKDVMTMMGQKMYSVRDGVTGWKTGMAGIQQMTEDELLDEQKQDKRKTILILQNADSDQMKAVFAGTGTVNGTDVSYVKILDNADEAICKLGIADDGAIVCKEYWGQTPIGEGNIQEVIMETAEFSGVKFSVNSVQNLNGNKFGETKTDAIVVNGEVAADAFAKPE